MSRKPSGSPEEVERALRTAETTLSAIELRRSLAVTLPVVHGLSLKQTAELLGRSEAWVAKERLNFIKNVPRQVNDRPSGGRRNQLIPADQEDALMELVCHRFIKIHSEWRLGITKGKDAYSQTKKDFLQLVMDVIEEKIQRKTTRTTAYNLMARTGRRRFADYKPSDWVRACNRELPGSLVRNEPIAKYLAERYNLTIRKKRRVRSND